MKIESLTDPRISEFLTLKNKVLPKNQMIAESHKVVSKAIATGNKILKIFCTEEYKEKNRDLFQNFSEITYSSDKKIMEEVIGYKLHHGVMALLEKPQFVTLNQLDNRILILNGLTSPENVGTIIRTAASFNIRSIIIDQKTCSPYLRRCARVSMGNIFFVRIHLSHNLNLTLKQLQAEDYDVISAANTNQALPLQHYVLKQKTAIIIGSEGHGIDDTTIAASSNIVKINIEEDVAHINAASAASIFLYQLSLDKR